MKVLYDSQIFDVQKFGGVSRYFSELFAGISRDSEIQPFISVKKTTNIHFKEIVKHNSKNIYSLSGSIMDIYYKLLPSMHHKYVNREYSVKTLRENAFDLFHPTYFDPYFLEYLSKPYVVTVYDLIYELFPNDFNREEDEETRKQKKLTIENCNSIIAISEHTKRDLMHYYNIDERKISVIHLGNSLTKKKDIEQKKKVAYQYILFVGLRNRYKNFTFFLRSIQDILLSNKSLQLICAGPKFTTEEQQLFKELGIEKQIQHHLATDETLSLLYANAMIFVFPSLYEGFGLPILEAFSSGCPVMCSNTSSLPEIAGDAALLFDPKNSDEIASSLQKIIDNKELREHLSRSGYDQLKYFSWKSTVEQTKEVYKKVLATR